MATACEILEEFAGSSSAGFRCFAAGAESGPRFIARVRHVLNPPASSACIARIREMLGRYAAGVVAFYERHDGFVLYHDGLSDAAGVELLSAGEWAEATDDMRQCFHDLAEKPSLDPDHIVTGIAIATVRHSGNYFVMPTDGPAGGKVFYANHDGWYESAFADNFDGFLVHATQEPVKLLNDELGCYTRFSDGRTNAQWIPEEYLPDAPAVRS